ncbi:hypothetical protein FI667_g15393, partial [Globisporangium splendens]
MVSTKLLVAAFVVLAASAVDAHSTLDKSGLTFTVKAHSDDFSATVPMNKLTPQWDEIFANYPSWTANTKASSYKSLKEFIFKNQELRKGRVSNPKTAECGFTDPNKGPVQALSTNSNDRRPVHERLRGELPAGQDPAQQGQVRGQEPLDPLLDVDALGVAGVHRLRQDRQRQEARGPRGCLGGDAANSPSLYFGYAMHAQLEREWNN